MLGARGPSGHDARLVSTDRKRRRWPVRIAIAGAVIVAIGLVGLAAFAVTGWLRERRAIDAIRARGEPLSAAEIVFPAGAPPTDLLERVRRFRDADGEAPTFGFRHASKLGELLAELRAAEAWSAAAIAVERLDCFGDDARSADDIARAVEARLADPRRAREITECERRFVLARGSVAEPLLALALDVCRAEHDTGERATREWSPRDGPGPGGDRTPTSLLPAVRIVAHVAVARAVEGRTSEALELVELALRGANRLRGWPSLFGYSFANAARSEALQALRAILPSLPDDADLARIDAELAAIDPPAELERAVVCERAFGNETFTALRDGRLLGEEVSPGAPTGFFDFLLVSTLGHDRANYLERMSAAVAWARRPLADVETEVAALERSGSLASKASVLSMLLVPRFGTLLNGSSRVQASTALARAAIRARAEGAAAGIRAAAATADPFGTASLRARLDADGTLVLWSFGSNFVDDGAREDEPSTVDPSDLVWRVSPR